jgi:hypothetical protein
VDDGGLGPAWIWWLLTAMGIAATLVFAYLIEHPLPGESGRLGFSSKSRRRWYVAFTVVMGVFTLGFFAAAVIATFT